jgi:2-methylcitrate dehydratase PrpD
VEVTGHFRPTGRQDTRPATDDEEHVIPPQTISRQFAEFISSTDIAQLPTGLVRESKLRILDALSTALVSGRLPVPSAALALAATSGGSATVIGQPDTTAPADAAFVNATLINGRTQDDFLAKSHPGAVVLPAALAAGEAARASGADLLAAVIAGYDVTARAYLGGPEMLPAFRATGVAGTVGAAAAAARVLKLDSDQTVHALGCAAVFASGFGAGFLAGTMDVKLNVGMASRNGVTAALLARAGATATDLAFEGKSGFYEAFARTADNADRAVTDLGTHYMLTDTVYKEYPVCIFVQTPVITAKSLRDEHGLSAADIRRVTITVSEPTYTNPGFTNRAPFSSALQARVSARFCVSAALLGRPIDDFDLYDHFDDPEILALMERIDLELDPAAGDSVTVVIDLGRDVVRARAAEGEALRPSEKKITEKFLRLAPGNPNIDHESIRQDVIGLDKLDDVRDLTRHLRPTTA